MRAIITRGLYIFEVLFFVFEEFFLHLSLFMVSILERFVIQTRRHFLFKN